jgi:hypothetical protein
MPYTSIITKSAMILPLENNKYNPHKIKIIKYIAVSFRMERSNIRYMIQNIPIHRFIAIEPPPPTFSIKRPPVYPYKTTAKGADAAAA